MVVSSVLDDRRTVSGLLCEVAVFELLLSTAGGPFPDGGRYFLVLITSTRLFMNSSVFV